MRKNMWTNFATLQAIDLLGDSVQFGLVCLFGVVLFCP